MSRPMWKSGPKTSSIARVDHANEEALTFLHEYTVVTERVDTEERTGILNRLEAHVCLEATGIDRQPTVIAPDVEVEAVALLAQSEVDGDVADRAGLTRVHREGESLQIAWLAGGAVDAEVLELKWPVDADLTVQIVRLAGGAATAEGGYLG